MCRGPLWFFGEWPALQGPQHVGSLPHLWDAEWAMRFRWIGWIDGFIELDDGW